MFNAKFFFGWNNFKKIFKDIYATFSNEKSFLSSKRLTTGGANISVIFLTIFFVIIMTWRDRLDASGFAIVMAPLVAMGAYNVAQTMKDKKNEPQIKTDQNEKQ